MKAGRFLSNWGRNRGSASFWRVRYSGGSSAAGRNDGNTMVTITDPTGSVVPEAKVTLSSPERGITRTFTTGAQGNYSFSQLAPSTYQLTIQAKGFNQYIQNGITLDAGQSASQDITLTVGSVDQQVVVSSQASLLNTENSNISAEVDRRDCRAPPQSAKHLQPCNPQLFGKQQRGIPGAAGRRRNSTDSADQDVSFMNLRRLFWGLPVFCWMEPLMSLPIGKKR